MALRLDSVWTGLGGSPYFTSWFGNGSSDVGGAQALVDAAETFVTNMTGHISGLLVWNTDDIVTVFDPVTGNPTATVGVTGATASGSASGDINPRASQGLLRYRTGIYNEGREVVGKLYLPGCPESSNGSFGAPNGTFTSQMNAAGAVLVADNAAAISVWSRKYGTINRVISATCSPEWAVLRSRRD